MYFEFHHFERGLSLLKRRHYYLALKLTAGVAVVTISSFYFGNRIHNDYEFRCKVKSRYPKLVETYYDCIEAQGYPMRDLDKLRFRHEQHLKK